MGNDTFTYTVSDGNGGSDIGTVTITVSSVDQIVAGMANWTPGVAGASSITQINAWSRIATQTTGTAISGSAPTVAAGTNRLLVIALNWDAGTAYIPNLVNFVVTCGGTTMAPGEIANTSSNRAGHYMAYLTDADAAFCSGTTIQVSGMNNHNSTDMYAAVFANVDQTTPVQATGYASNETTGTTGTFGSNVAVVNNGWIFYQLSFDRAAGAHTPPATYSNAWAYATNGTSHSSSGGQKAITANGNENPTLTWTTAARYSARAVSLNPAAGTPSPATLDVLAANTSGALGGNVVHADYNGSTYDLTNISGNRWSFSGEDLSDAYASTIRIYSDQDTSGQTYPVINDGGALSWPAVAITLASWNGIDNVDVWATSDWNDQDQLFVDYNGSGAIAMTWNGTNSRWEHTFTGYASFVAGNATVTSESASNSPQIQAVVDSTANNPPVANNDGTYSVSVSSTGNNFDVLANDSDGGDGPASLTVVGVGTDSCGGTPAIGAGNLSIDYDAPGTVQSGCTFTYTISDGADTAQGTVTVAVTAAEPSVLGTPASTAGGSTTDPITITGFTAPAGTNRVLIIYAGSENTTGPTVVTSTSTFNGLNPTTIFQQTNGRDSQWFGYIPLGTGGAITSNISIDWSAASAQGYLWAVVYENAAQTQTLNWAATSTTNNLSTTINTPDGARVIYATHWNAADTSGNFLTSPTTDTWTTYVEDDASGGWHCGIEARNETNANAALVTNPANTGVTSNRSNLLVIAVEKY